MNDTSKPGDEPTPNEHSMQNGQPGGGPDVDNDDAAADAAAGEISAAQLRQMVEALQIDLDSKTAELAAKQDQVLRALAETENVRRRLEKEKAEMAKFAIQKFAKDMLSIGDNFQRAIAAVPPGAADADPALKALIEGVVLAERDYRSALERHGVIAIDPAGQPFNPHHHQAVMEQEDKTVPSGTVLQVYQVGYLLEGRCLRPAMVVVSRGGPKSAKPAEAAQFDSADDGTDGEAAGDDQDAPRSAD